MVIATQDATPRVLSNAMSSVGLGRPLTSVRAVLSVTYTVVLASLPAFLIGATAVLIRTEFGFNERALGVLIAVFYATSGLISVPGGKLGDVIGARRALLLSTTGTGLSLLGMATVASSYGHLVALLVLAGASQATAQPASNLALSRGVGRQWLGLAFGLKQAAIPTATLLAGLSVPIIALTLGWRWAFVLPAAATLVVPFALPKLSWAGAPRAGSHAADSARGPLLLLAVAGGFGSAAAVAMPAFLVEAAVSRGIGAGTGGLILALGSVVGIASRITAGWRADHRDGGHLLVVAAMLGSGVVGYLLLAFAQNTPMFVVGGMIGFAAGWGWPGLFIFAFARLNPVATGAGTGIGQAGAMTGAMIGPIIFGVLIAEVSYVAAWSMAAVEAGVAALLVLLGRAWILRLRRLGTSVRAPRPRRG